MEDPKDENCKYTDKQILPISQLLSWNKNNIL